MKRSFYPNPWILIRHWNVFTCLIAFTWALSSLGNPPNIIVILADDMGMGDTSAYQFPGANFNENSDAQQIDTPELENLAKRGIRFTDAHTSSAVCTPSRYSFLTGRYPWRNRLSNDPGLLGGVLARGKPQGDPLIKSGVRTVAQMLKDEANYRTALTGKWHLGLRYRNAQGSPIPLGLDEATGEHWQRADLSKPLADSPINHGFDYFFGHSRSHGTSGPDGSSGNTSTQEKGPGYLESKTVGGVFGVYSVSATNDPSDGKKMKGSGSLNGYEFSEIGSRVFDKTIDWMDEQLSNHGSNPFFLYYALHSNHTPYTPSPDINGVAADNGVFKNGTFGSDRVDFVEQTDVIVGEIVAYLEGTNDPRSPGKKLIDNTLIIFASDNGADERSAVGKQVGQKFSGKKSEVLEGGHRIPFIAAWKDGGIGDGDVDANDNGGVSERLIGLQDLYATFASIVGYTLDDSINEAVDSVDVWDVFCDPNTAFRRSPMLFDGKMLVPPSDGILQGSVRWLAIRTDNNFALPGVSSPSAGKWKLMFDKRMINNQKSPALINGLSARVLYNLNVNEGELLSNNLIDQSNRQTLISGLEALTRDYVLNSRSR